MVRAIRTCLRKKCTAAQVIESLVCAIVEAMISHGAEPMIRRSANLDGNDDHNLKIQEQLLAQFPELKDVLTVF